MERIQLRQYQESVVKRALNALEKGEGVVINSPTGTGKTLMGFIKDQQFSFRCYDPQKVVNIGKYAEVCRY